MGSALMTASVTAPAFRLGACSCRGLPSWRVVRRQRGRHVVVWSALGFSSPFSSVALFPLFVGPVFFPPPPSPFGSAGGAAAPGSDPWSTTRDVFTSSFDQMLLTPARV